MSQQQPEESARLDAFVQRQVADAVRRKEARAAADAELRASTLASDTDRDLAAGVLNNAADADKSVRSLFEVVRPGGYLLITEPTREHVEILISQAFMMTPSEDERRRTDCTFLAVAQWLEVLRRAGATRVEVFPQEEHVLAPLGQRLFVVERP